MIASLITTTCFSNDWLAPWQVPYVVILRSTLTVSGFSLFHQKCAALLNMLQENEINAVFPAEQFSLLIPPQALDAHKSHHACPPSCLCKREKLAWFFPAFVCAHTPTHICTHTDETQTQQPTSTGTLWISYLPDIPAYYTWLTAYPPEIQPNKEIYSLSRTLSYRRLCNHQLSSI